MVTEEDALELQTRRDTVERHAIAYALRENTARLRANAEAGANDERRTIHDICTCNDCMMGRICACAIDETSDPPYITLSGWLGNVPDDDLPILETGSAAIWRARRPNDGT